MRGRGDHQSRASVTFRTRAAHAGDDASASIRPLSEPVAQASVYGFRDPADADARLAADSPEPTYSRDGLHNASSLERTVADLESADDAHATASGMAAISLVFLAHLAAQDAVVISADVYCDVAALLTEELSRFGVDAAFVDLTDLDAVRAAMTPRTRMIYCETISNPAMKLVDLESLARIANANGALLVVDNTFATPALCRPLEHGADLVIHSATKFLGGHHDLSAGVVCGRADLVARIHRVGSLYGPTVAPLDAWLAVRGMKTLAPRMAWASESAGTIARYLEDHPAVSAVRYPGLPSYPQAELARRLLPDGAGAMVAFDIGAGPEAAELMVRSLGFIPYALSLGGTVTTVCYPPRAAPAIPVDENTDGHRVGSVNGAGSGPSRRRSATLRLSVGLESAQDIIADLGQALAAGRAERSTAEPPRRVPARSD